jgi:selenide,water dikinase
VLSKPLGTGIVLAGGADDAKTAAITRMRMLNRAASEALQELGPAVHAVTDVTGFGLAGHGWEMAERSGVQIVFDTGGLPLYEGALEAAEAGVRTGGDARNRSYLEGHVLSDAPAALDALAFDPQTSGGLLAAVDSGVAANLEGFTMVGVVEQGSPGVRIT